MSNSPHGIHESAPVNSIQNQSSAALHTPEPARAHVIMPVQATGVRPPIPSTINHMVQGMIPALQRQLSDTMNMATSNNTNNNPISPRSTNPFLNQIPNFSIGGHSTGNVNRQSRGQGHVRSFSYGNFGQNLQNSGGSNGAHGNLPFHPAQQHGHMITQAAENVGNHQHHHHHHVHHHQTAASNSQPNTPSTSQINASFVLDLGDNGLDISEGLGGGGGAIGAAAPPPQDNNNNGHHHQQRGGTASGVGNDLRTLWKASEGSIPFVLLMLAKILFHHRLGIIVLIGLFGTFYHANTSLKKQIAQREGHSFFDTLGNLCWIIVFLSANVFFIYYVFDEQMLYRSLFFHVPIVGDGTMTVWNMCWIVGVTDFIIKYATIILKAVVTLLPKNVLLFKKKGKYYMMIEVLSQFYRSLIPVVPWLLYLQTAESGEQWFAYVLCLLYLVCKGNHVYVKLKELKRTISKFRIDVSYGSIPSVDDLQGCDNSCPICQDKFTDPVMLTCTHIFCEDCVSMWFDRERTCPMCRAQIVDNPMWRDGSTAANIQLY